MDSALASRGGMVRGLDFELAYLSLLTLEGLKPLSRWEKQIDGTTLGSLKRLGLKTRIVDRSVQCGRDVKELLLSTSDSALEDYASNFSGLPVNRDEATIYCEGRLFGYPPCCVQSFATRGYVRNSLRRCDQRILFHWACPDCTVTPHLLPAYRRIYRLCRAMRRGRPWQTVSDLVEAMASRRLRPRMALAVSLAAMGMLPASVLNVAADPLDPHVTALNLYDDPDSDFLLSSEERILGLDPQLPDQNTNAVPDGVDLAKALSTILDALPAEPSATNVYLTHHMAFGLEHCTVCGEPVNMGLMEVQNPLENQVIAVPYIAKHYLEHGSFSYSGSEHSGRVNPPLLKFILQSDGLGHLIPEPLRTDLDRDGLRDWEEPTFQTDPGTPDSDGDAVLDGIDVARELRRSLELLPVAPRPEDGPKDRPFVVQYPMDGLETCPRCGLVQTMGFWQIINPVISESLYVTTMALHYLEHGAFGWEGGVLQNGQGRIDPRQLQALLAGNSNRHLLPLSEDKDADWLENEEEASLKKNPGNPDEDGNSVRDGLDLARTVICEIAGLPATPSSDKVYRVDVQLRGLEQCQVCGTNVNMGYVTLCNPQAKLSMDIPYIALHYLEHDGFSYAGDVHGKGRVDIQALLDVLFRPAVNVAADGPELTLRWIAKTGRSYQVFSAASLDGPWTGGPVIPGDGTEKVFSETKPAGAESRFFKVVVW